MSIDPDLNKLLKKMWRLDEKLKTGKELTKQESKFYFDHLSTIQNYYNTQASYWNDR